MANISYVMDLYGDSLYKLGKGAWKYVNSMQISSMNMKWFTYIIDSKFSVCALIS